MGSIIATAMVYRVCKSFHIESGHMLSKHAGLCRFPHGHSRRVDVVLASGTLDENGMVCDFKALKLAVKPLMDQYDHAMLVNAADETMLELRKGPLGARIVAIDDEPTTEVIARLIYVHVAGELKAGKVYYDERGVAYGLRAGVTLERVRVSETETTWAEYGL